MKNAKVLLEDLVAGDASLDEVKHLVREEQANKKLREQAVMMLLSSIPNEDPEREGLLETPLRVAKMYDEIFGGYEMDPSAILNKTFAAGEEDFSCGGEDIYRNGIVAVKDIAFYSHCEHHMVPFIGKVWVAYIPATRVVGLSKIARLVECYARRLQIQERMTTQIADALVNVLSPLGVMVVIEAEHLCMAMRGVKKPGTKTITSAVRGVFADDMAAREECLALLGLK